MTDAEILERAIINTLRERAGCSAPPEFEKAAAELLRELDGLVREYREGPKGWLPRDATPEQTLDTICGKVAQTALSNGLTVVLSASVPVGKLHYQRVVAQSPAVGSYGANLIQACIKQAVNFSAKVDPGGSHDN